MRSAKPHLNELANNCTLAFSASRILTPSPVSAMVVAPAGSSQQLRQDNPVIEVVVRRGPAAHRTTVVGPRGNAASRTVVRRGAVARRGVVRSGGRVRPANYYWRPGGAIAAGGFVAATAADPGKTQGFRDVCP
jgi:hypothetical protein